jgi:FkbM family methyltransferase
VHRASVLGCGLKEPRVEVSDAMQEVQFEHYSRKQRVVAWVSRNLFDGITYTVRHGLLRGMKRKGGLGWLPDSLIKAEVTAESKFWETAPLRGAVVYDIGAFHGMLTLWFARHANQVVSYEPVAQNRARLLENLSLNRIQNVTVRDVALGGGAGAAVMRVDPLMPGGSKVVVEENASRDAGLEPAIGRVRVTTLDQDIEERGLPAPTFLKIDVEGFELDVLRGAAQTLARGRPALFIEIHGETLAGKQRNAAAVVQFLHEAGYGPIQHIESGTEVSPGNSDVAAQGHLYCEGKVPRGGPGR